LLGAQKKLLIERDISYGLSDFPLSFFYLVWNQQNEVLKLSHLRMPYIAEMHALVTL